MLSDGQLITELLNLVDSKPLTKVDFEPLLKNHSRGLSFEEQRQLRGVFRRVLLDLKRNEDIDYYDAEINISVSTGQNWHGYGGLIKSTLKRKEKLDAIERENKRHEVSQKLSIAGDFKGILNTGKIEGNQEYLEASLPINQPTTPPIKPQRNVIQRIWNWLMTNPIITGIIAGVISTIIATVILRHYQVI